MCRSARERTWWGDGVVSLQAWCMMREVSGLIYNATEEQVVRARNQLKASILFQQDGPGGVHPSRLAAQAVQKPWQLARAEFPLSRIYLSPSS